MKSALDGTSGYIALPRSLAKNIVEDMAITDAPSLYFYLLYTASYATRKSKFGTLKRGETDITLKEIATATNTEYPKIRRLMKQLLEEELLEYKQIGTHRLIILPYYEEHCGNKVRKAQQATPHTPAQNKTDTDFDLFWEFYHEMIPSVPQQDYAKARKIYGRLSIEEREMSARQVEAYYNALDSEKHAKWAVNYLKDKSFMGLTKEEI